ncbi:MAG: NAD(+) synthase [Acetatifactor sp.]|nr:NAD(+) synthase [Acetatifactor sp.]
MMKEFDAVKVRKEIVEWIREWFEENGPKATAVIGISGGKDSSVTAALLKEALGKDRVMGVMMPQGVQPDIDDSIRVVESLGIPHCTISVGTGVDAVLSEVAKAMVPSRDAQINTPPRIRMATLYAVAASMPNGGRVANTCNLSEDWIGYSTKYGDAAGDFSPISDLTVQEVKAIGDTYEELPKELVHKTPSDGLCGQSDEDKIGFTYATLDRYIREGICEDEEIRKKIDRMHALNLHKLRVIPKFQQK